MGKIFLISKVSKRLKKIKKNYENLIDPKKEYNEYSKVVISY